MVQLYSLLFYPSLLSILFLGVQCSAHDRNASRYLGESITCNWPIDLSLERDGKYQDHQSKNTQGSIRGRSGNTIIQYMMFRLNAAAFGGFTYPWTGLVGMEESTDKNNKNVEVWGPRFGKLGSCKDNARQPSEYCPKTTGEISAISNPLPKSTAVQKCSSNDDKFHQNYEYFRGNREATRYFMATADDLDANELQAWERIMEPSKVWKPKKWVGPNDAVIHLRVFEDLRKVDKETGAPCDHGDKNTRAKCNPGEWISLACDNAHKHMHLCSWTRDLVDDSLFRDGTCDEHLFHPPFSYYENVFKTRADREEARTGKRIGVGGWDNVWLLSDPKGHNSELAKRLISELGVKVPFHHSDRGYSGPLHDIWSIKSAPYIIASYGTFSWVGAFLSRAKEIHKPYTSNNWGNHWAEEAGLFVDDQEEYIYHNTETGKYFLTAAEVMEDKNTAFVQGVMNRKVKNRIPPIPSNENACNSRQGKWTGCGGGNAEASCSIRGVKLFTAPCKSACYAS